MTDEELQETIDEIEGELDALGEPDESWSGEQKRERRLLLTKKNILGNIQRDKERNNMQQEMQHSAEYSLVCEYGHKHPLLLFFMRNKFRWNIF